MLKKDRVLNAFNNKPVDRVPVGFWFHFIPDEICHKGLEDASLKEQNIKGHRKFINETNPDFVKIMSDGYFYYPREEYNNLNDAKDLMKIKPLGKDHKWIREQVEMAKEVVDILEGTCGFYNVFSPSTTLKTAINDEKYIELFRQDPDAVYYALDVLAQDLADLSELVIKEAKADGIYLSVQNPNNAELTYEEYRKYITPSEKKVLARANKESDNNILHCCGYAGNKNNLDVWLDYDAKAINWAVTIENVGLKEGKKLFGDKAVIGGFDNREGKILHSGSKEEIEELTEDIIRENGEVGILIGADCTVPFDINTDRFVWVKDKVKDMKKKEI